MRVTFTMALTLYELKPRFQALLRPLTRALAGARVSANQITILALVLSLAVGAFIFAYADRTWPFLLLPAWLFLRMALNAIDGMLAREFDQRSALGAYLNELSDVIADATLYLPFARVPPFDPFWVGAVIFAAAVSEMAGALAPMVGAARRYDGPLGKSDRAFVFGALALWIGAGGALPGFLRWLMPLVFALIVWNVVNRVRRGVADAHDNR
jgi:CDP-diacylglycerol--glycerol-3-phosphate 3-phosphatidyltransferase